MLNLSKLPKTATIKVTPTALQGTVQVPSSKSMGHREIICAGLANGTSIVDNISMSKDIQATMRCLRAIGVTIDEIPSMIPGRTALQVTGTGHPMASADYADCGESGSTLRFFMPIVALLDCPLTLMGEGKLVERPLKAYYDIFDEQGVQYINDEGKLPVTINGHLKPGIFKLPGDVSSQFVSGLLFALPLLQGDSEIVITSPLESASYVDLTLNCLAKYGIRAENVDGKYERFLVPGKQHYQPRDSKVEGDWSQVAFWAVAGAATAEGKQVTCEGVDFGSAQGDKALVDILTRMGANLTKTENTLKVESGTTKETVIDATNCPDIIPVLSALAAVSEGTTKFVNAGRLRIKECDRLAAMTQELNKLGAEVTEEPEGMTVIGHPEGLKGGVTVDAWNDHRIAMSLGIIAERCAQPIVITGAGSVSKSYPEFWQDYRLLGGEIEVLP